MDSDKLIMKSSGHYTEIRYNNIVLVAVKTDLQDKCELCHFQNKIAACCMMTCDGVVYKQLKK